MHDRSPPCRAEGREYESESLQTESSASYTRRKYPRPAQGTKRAGPSISICSSPNLSACCCVLRQLLVRKGNVPDPAAEAEVARDGSADAARQPLRVGLGQLAALDRAGAHRRDVARFDDRVRHALLHLSSQIRRAVSLANFTHWPSCRARGLTCEMHVT